jgi:CDP-glucose 4,6-dehydratase
MRGNEGAKTPGDMKSSFSGKTVLVTGHTGFKGAWLSEWLLMLGARVIGVSLPPNTSPSLFAQLHLADRMDSHLIDIRDADALTRVVTASQPDFVFHLAAQPLVRASYLDPVSNYATNVMGTVHLLHALTQLQADYSGGKYCAVVIVTSDKCYANQEWMFGYRENDRLGGHDPYSSSKACAELVVASFRQSFFEPERSDRILRVGLSTVRAGNVIGGGDWAPDRIVPDCIRNLKSGQAIPIRNPAATRPWQHVLEPLAGYLGLAAHQRRALEAQDSLALSKYCSAFNFGPDIESCLPVGRLVEEVLLHWPGKSEVQSHPNQPHEAMRLHLNCDKAFHLCNWRPQWGFEESIGRTVHWYRKQMTGQESAGSLTQSDILDYERASTRINVRQPQIAEVAP